MKKPNIEKYNLPEFWNDVLIMETPDDINDGRYQEVQNYMFQIYSYVDKPDPTKFIEQYQKAMNSNSVAGCHEAFYDYKFSLQNFNADNPSAWAMMFGLITIEPGEDQGSKLTRDTNYLSEKIDRFRANGLSAGMVRDEVEAFFFKCPELSELFSRIQQIILSNKFSGLSDYFTAGEPEQTA